MTTRNLNQTWRDIVFKQYAADYEADVPFPVRYLIKASPWNKDVFINIPNKIEIRTLRHAVRDWHLARRNEDDPAFSNEFVTVEARIPWRMRNQDGDQDVADDDSANEGAVDTEQ
jgi:hypothetical protein